jgi:hypothetical protein
MVWLRGVLAALLSRFTVTSTFRGIRQKSARIGPEAPMLECSSASREGTADLALDHDSPSCPVERLGRGVLIEDPEVEGRRWPAIQ